MKLFEITIEAITYVVAKDEDEANRIASKNLSDLDWEYSAHEKKGEKATCFATWIDEIPFGEDYLDEELTVDEIIHLIKENARKERMESEMEKLQLSLL